MQKMREQYIIDSYGKKSKIILDMKYYAYLQNLIEDLLDALDIKKAKAEKSRGYEEYLRERNKIKRWMYKIEIKSGAEKQLNKLSKNIFTKISDGILQLKENPRQRGCEKLTMLQGYKIRCGDYRILYDVNIFLLTKWKENGKCPCFFLFFLLFFLTTNRGLRKSKKQLKI